MKIFYKQLFLLMFTLSICWANSMSPCDIEPVQKVIRFLAGHSKIFARLVSRHRYAGAAVLATATLSAIPRARATIVHSSNTFIKTIGSWMATAMLYGGAVCRIPLLMRLGDRLYEKTHEQYYVVDEPDKGRDRWTPLHWAARLGHAAVIRTLIRAGCNTHIQNGDQWTPLHEAVERGHVDILGALIAAGADVNARDRFGQAPLHEAVSRGHINAVRALIAAGADVNVSIGDGFGTPLHAASRCRDNSNLDIVDTLVTAGANINAQNAYGKTPLHVASQSGHISIIHRLVQAGASMDARDRNEQTPLHEATTCRQINAIGALAMAGANINARDGLGRTPLHIATSYSSPFYDMNHVSHFDIVHALIQAGADVNIRDNRGFSPLDTAWTRNPDEWAILRSLIKAGADIDSTVGDTGLTPLALAAHITSYSLVDVLLEAGANIYIRDRFGRTACDLALACGNYAIAANIAAMPQRVNILRNAIIKNDMAGLEVLIRPSGFPAGIGMRGSDGNTAIHSAIGKYVRERPTTLDVMARILIRTIGSRRAAVLRNREERTPLHIAAMQNNLWIAEYLLRHGYPDVNARDKYGNTPLHYVVSRQMRDKLLQHRADCSMVNNARGTSIAATINLWHCAFNEAAHASDKVHAS